MNDFIENSYTDCTQARFAVVGESSTHAGVIAWHLNEFAAHLDARNVRQEGGKAVVQKADELSFQNTEGRVFKVGEDEEDGGIIMMPNGKGGLDSLLR